MPRHFAKTHVDLTLQKYFVLALPGATDGQLQLAFRWAARHLREEPRERPETPESPQTPVIRQIKHRVPTWR